MFAIAKLLPRRAGYAAFYLREVMGDEIVASCLAACAGAVNRKEVT
jgi:hypothetical protein